MNKEKAILLGIGLGFIQFVSFNTNFLIYFLGTFGGGLIGIIVLAELHYLNSSPNFKINNLKEWREGK